MLYIYHALNMTFEISIAQRSKGVHDWQAKDQGQHDARHKA